MIGKSAITLRSGTSKAKIAKKKRLIDWCLAKKENRPSDQHFKNI